MPLARVEEAIADIRAGKMVIICDDEDRENEGDLAMAAESVTPQHVNFMATHARGLICMPMLGHRLEDLRLPLMTQENTARLGTAFTVSVDVLNGATTGISAFDRAATIKSLIDPNTVPEDLGRPGHIFPLRYMEGGVLKRAGQTEASVDLARLAGLYPASVICEIMADDGNMARLPTLEKFSQEHDIKIVTVADIITFRREHEKLIERVAQARVPTEHGEFLAVSYRSLVDPNEHIALVKGEITANKPVLVRVHSECLTGDVFGSIRCDCGGQMELALQAIERDGAGIFLYMRQEGRGIGIHNKLKAYELQDAGMDTVEANIALGFAPDPRQYGVGAQILLDLGVNKMRLLTNNPQKRVGLESFGLEIVEQVGILAEVTPENRRYLKAKQEKLGHSLDPMQDEFNAGAAQ
jgi:3,4-dihydroxy 2-butanone 4-phosphate synthase/GTP cyclohydrolase II